MQKKLINRNSSKVKQSKDVHFTLLYFTLRYFMGQIKQNQVSINKENLLSFTSHFVVNFVLIPNI
jgi:hypothetical protein